MAHQEEGSEEGLADEDLAKDLLLQRYARLLSAPDEWRRRASTAAGLLSAAAAALLAGLLLQPPTQEVQPAVKYLTTGAVILYLCAVIAFLEASTRAPKDIEFDPESETLREVKHARRRQVQSEPGNNIPDQSAGIIPALVDQEVGMQVAPLSKAVKWGRWFAIGAISLTVFSVLAFFWGGSPQGFVKVTDVDSRRDIKTLCPQYDAHDAVQINSLTPDSVTFTIPAEICTTGEVRVVLPGTSTIVSFKP